MKASEAQEHAIMAVVWAVPASWGFSWAVLGSEMGYSIWGTLSAWLLFFVFGYLSFRQLLQITDKKKEDDPYWYCGIVVKDVTVKHWEAVSERNQLATCAEWVMELSEGKLEKASRQHHHLSQELMGQVNLMIKARSIWNDDDLIAEVAKDRGERLNFPMTMEDRDEEIRELQAEYDEGMQGLRGLGLLKDREDGG